MVRWLVGFLWVAVARSDLPAVFRTSAFQILVLEDIIKVVLQRFEEEVIGIITLTWCVVRGSPVELTD